MVRLGSNRRTREKVPDTFSSRPAHAYFEVGRKNLNDTARRAGILAVTVVPGVPQSNFSRRKITLRYAALLHHMPTQILRREFLNRKYDFTQGDVVGEIRREHIENFWHSLKLGRHVRRKRGARSGSS